MTTAFSPLVGFFVRFFFDIFMEFSYQLIWCLNVEFRWFWQKDDKWTKPITSPLAHAWVVVIMAFSLPCFGGPHLPCDLSAPLLFQYVHLDKHQSKLCLHAYSVWIRKLCTHRINNHSHVAIYTSLIVISYCHRTYLLWEWSLNMLFQVRKLVKPTPLVYLALLYLHCSAHSHSFLSPVTPVLHLHYPYN